GTTSLLLYWIGSRLNDALSGTFAMILFGLTMGWGLMDGPNTAQTESFMILFIVLAFVFAIKARVTTDRRLRVVSIFMSGLCLGLAIAFKQIAVFSAAAVVLFLPTVDKKFTRDFLRDAAVLVVGVMISTFATLLPLLFSGVSAMDYWRGAWLSLVQEGTR